MKKSELSFKCVVPDAKCLDNIIAKIVKTFPEHKEIVHFATKTEKGKAAFVSVSFNPGFTFGLCSESEHFCAWIEPLMSYEDALKLIESIEPDAPEFDIKPFDRILARGANGSKWLARLYESKESFHFIETSGCFCNQLIKYDGNEHLHRTTNPAAGWWECENGKPVWRTK